MTMFSVGKATIVRIEETYQPVYNPKELFPEFTDEIYSEHKHWLAPGLAYADDADARRIDVLKFFEILYRGIQVLESAVIGQIDSLFTAQHGTAVTGEAVK